MDKLESRSFALFSALATELRLKIWQYCLPGPRTIGINFRMRRPDLSGWRSRDPIPVALHICHESRGEALKFYQLAFGSFFHQPSIYVDFDIDTVGFGNEETSLSDPDAPIEPSNYLLDVLLGGEYHGADDVEKVQRMVLDIDESLYDRRPFCWEEIRLFPRLKELTLISYNQTETADEVMRHFRTTLATVARAHPEWVVPDTRVVWRFSGQEWGHVKLPELEQSDD